MNEINDMPSNEEILMNEDEMIAGLLEAANYRDDKSCRRLVKIARPTGKMDSNHQPITKTFFTFTVRPLGEDELMDCRRKATPQRPHPNGPKWGKIDGNTNLPEFRAREIYAATVDEDRKRLWDNPKIKDKLNVIEGWEVIDRALMYLEKDAVLEIIDSISGEGADQVDYAKN